MSEETDRASHCEDEGETQPRRAALALLFGTLGAATLSHCAQQGDEPGTSGASAAPLTGSGVTTVLTLTTAITPTSTTATVSAGVPSAIGGHVWLIFDPYSTNAEIVQLTSASGSTINFTRNTAIATNHASGAYVAVLEELCVTPQLFGAAGDGSDDSGPINAAIKAVGMWGGGTVKFRAFSPALGDAAAPRLYAVGGTGLTISWSNVTLVGEEGVPIQAISTVSSATMPVLLQVGTSASPVTCVKIQNLTFDVNARVAGTRTVVTNPASGVIVYGSDCFISRVTIMNTRGIGNNPGNGLVFNGSRNRFDGCTAINCGTSTDISDGFYAGPAAAAVGSQNMIVDCIANTCTGTGFVLETCNFSGIVGCTATGCGTGAGISNFGDATMGIGNFMTGVTVNGATGTTGGIAVGPTRSSPSGLVKDTTLSGIVITGSGTAGAPALWLGAPGASIQQIAQGITVTGLAIDWTGTGQHGVLIAPGTTDVLISGGSVLADLDAILIASGLDGGGNVQACKRITIEGMRLYPGANADGVRIGYGNMGGYGVYWGGCDRITVQGCTFARNPSPGTAYLYAVYAYGATAACTNVWIVANVIPSTTDYSASGGDFGAEAPTSLTIQRCIGAAAAASTGANVTLGKTGSGPSSVTQSGWLQVHQFGSTKYWIPVWT